jgi:DNA polymerase I-like protein with 3'-5' exonuclease and polymerase domains
MRLKKILVLDLETTVEFREDGTKDNSPFNPDNKVVSAHWRFIVDGKVGPASNLVFHHNEKSVPDSPTSLRDAIEQADVLVAHNAKYDIMYLAEIGMPIPEQVYCTMIGEYILARGQRVELSLKAVADKRRVTLKKGELIDEMFAKKIGFEAMPLATVLEYADADVLSCAEVYLSQIAEFDQDENKGLLPVSTLMNEMLMFLVEIERNGVKIDMDILNQVEIDYLAEKEELEKTLSDIIRDVMGDTPINLQSGADMSKVIYSREVVDKKLHKETFNIGLDHRGKPMMRPRMTPSAFAQAVRTTTKKVMRTVAYHCDACKGSGKYFKLKKDGKPWKNSSTCPECEGRGYVLMENGKVAGLKLSPTSVEDVGINGFNADKATIKKLIYQAETKHNLQAIQFLNAMSRLNAVDTYLNSFVRGIQRYTRPDGLLHAQFNQTTTRTGRLSSSNPNFQNQPKGHKFPVRKAVVSRFNNGQIMEADFSGLEFRVAGELSRDPQIIEDILSGKDVHKQTAMIINQCALEDVTKDMRQNAKATTFAPLYGGMGASEPPHIQNYFHEYFNIYQGLARWHKKLMDGVLRDGKVRIPSGREFVFLNAKRLRNGRITNATAVVNYPVQSFATADIVPLACIRAHRRFQELSLKSKLVLTVHDSIAADCHPDEIKQVAQALSWAMMGVSEEVKERFGYEMSLPLNIEISAGPNWMEMSELHLDV